MNPVVGSLLEEFSNDNSLKSLAQDVRFEHFVNFSIVHPKLPESFDYTLIHTGEGEFGVDGVAVIINDRLIEDEEMAKDVIENAHSIEVEIVFVQAKMGESFKSGEVLKFLTAVKVFFNTELDPGNVVNNIEKIIEARKIFACVMENSNKCKKKLA